MGERIYIMSGEGLEPMEEEPFDLEDTLQALIAEHPELIDGEQVRPGDPRRWILVKREQGIAETAGAGALWAVDLLLIDQDAMPTLVEVKRGSNSEIRRKVVGQMLDYAAHAPRSWTADELRRTFEGSNDDPDSALWSLLGEGEEEDEEADEEEEYELWQSMKDEFWGKVATNLAAKNLRLLFVADAIPDELARVVEFLNEQMPRIEVLAVELKQFKGRSSRTQTLVPRVIGRTAAAPGRGTGVQNPRMTRELFLEELPTGEARTAADRLFNVARDNGATFEWGPSGVSIRGRCSRWQQPITVAWLYPPSKAGMGWMRTRDFTFGVGILDYENPAPEEGLRTILQGWADQFRDDSFTADVSSKGVKAWAIHPDDMVNHIDLLAERLERVLSDLQAQ